MPKISFRLNSASISKAIQDIEAYKKKVESLGDAIAKAMAEIGYNVAYGVMQGHVFSGETAGSLTVEQVSENKYILYAESKAILFFEFGAGVRYGSGYPWGEIKWEDNPAYGPGTYPGAGHWDDPNGWWFPTDDPRLIISTSKDEDGNIQGWGHSYGNKPYMPFYKADKAIKDNLVEVARTLIKSGGYQ